MPTENDLDFDLFFEAMERFVEAKQRHDTAAKQYEGGSWGYHGNHLIETMTEARKEAKEQLTKVVRSIVDGMLNESKH